jgi:hypothetical protein
VIDEGKKFLFVRIPKTAGTTLSFALGERDFRDVGAPRMILEVNPSKPKGAEVPGRTENRSKFIFLLGGKEGPGSVHNNYEQWIDGFPEAKDYFTFSFVRNPWGWMFSLYNFFEKVCVHKRRRLFSGKAAARMETKRQMPQFEDTLGLFGISLNEFADNPEAITFDKFIDVYFSNDSYGKTQSSFLKNAGGGIDLDFIGRFERLQEDWDFIADKVGLKERSLSDTNRNYFPKRGLEKYLESSEIKAKITEGLAEDFENFNYSTNVIYK